MNDKAHPTFPVRGVASTLQPLVDLMATLRAPEGCPWDRRQTHGSLRKYLLEEVHECLEAIDDLVADPSSEHAAAHLCEELGDVLLQVAFHAQLAAERGAFTIADVVDGIVSKMVRRHPHVFGDESAADENDVLRVWSEAKKAEGRDERFGSMPLGMPALHLAQRLGKRAAAFGFDWAKRDDVLAKVDEELAELRDAIASGHEAAIREEFGDLCFTLASLARHLGLEAEEAATGASRKFRDRVRIMEAEAEARGVRLDDLGGDELEELWAHAKSAAAHAPR